MKYLIVWCLIACLAIHFITCRPIPKSKSTKNAPKRKPANNQQPSNPPKKLKSHKLPPLTEKEYDVYGEYSELPSRISPDINLESQFNGYGVYEQFRKESNEKFEQSKRAILFNRLVDAFRKMSPGKKQYFRHFSRASDANMLYVIAALGPNKELLEQMGKDMERAREEGEMYDFRDTLTERLFAKLVDSFIYAGSGEYLRAYDHFQCARNNIAGQLSTINLFKTSSQSIFIGTMVLDGEEMLIIGIRSEKTKEAIHFLEFAFVEHIRNGSFNDRPVHVNFDLLDNEDVAILAHWKVIGFLANYLLEELIRYFPTNHVIINASKLYPKTMPKNAPKDYIWNRIKDGKMYLPAAFNGVVRIHCFIPFHIANFGPFDRSQRLRLSFMFEAPMNRMFQYAPELAKLKREHIDPKLAQLRDKKYSADYEEMNLDKFVMLFYQWAYLCIDNIEDSDLKANLVVKMKMALADFNYNILRVFYRDNKNLFTTKLKLSLSNTMLLEVPAKLLNIMGSVDSRRSKSTAVVTQIVSSGTPLTSNDQTKEKIVAVKSQKRLSCPFCKSRFTNYDNYNTHVEKHQSIILYPCDLCRLYFSTESHLVGHFFHSSRHRAQSLAHHQPLDRREPKSFKGKFGCRECLYRSDRKFAVKKHATRLHITPRLQKGEKGPFSPDDWVTTANVDAETNQQQPIQAAEGDNVAEATNTNNADSPDDTNMEIDTEANPNEQSSIEDTAACPVNQQQRPDDHSTQPATVEEDEEDLLRCGRCDFVTNSQFVLYLHIMTVHPSQYEQCDGIESLIEVREHISVGAYTCNICQKPYSCPSPFQYHSKQHEEYAEQIIRMQNEVADKNHPRTKVTYADFYTRRKTAKQVEADSTKYKFFCGYAGCCTGRMTELAIYEHFLQTHKEVIPKEMPGKGKVETSVVQSTSANGKVSKSYRYDGKKWGAWRKENEDIVQFLKANYLKTNPNYVASTNTCRTKAAKSKATNKK